MKQYRTVYGKLMDKNDRKHSQLMIQAKIEKAQKDVAELARKYDAAVVWMGDNHYIVVKDGIEYRV